MSDYKLFLANYIATFSYIGKIPFAPGTFGTIAGWLIILIIFYQPYDFFVENNELYFAVGAGYINPDYILYILTISTILIYFIGQIASDYYSKKMGQLDPKEVVIDEVAGIFANITLSALIYGALLQFNEGEFLIYTSLSGYFFFLHLVLFRFFDIIKIYPVNLLDKNCKGGFGIMIDDIGAAVQSSIVFYIIFFSLYGLGVLDSMVSV